MEKGFKRLSRLGTAIATGVDSEKTDLEPESCLHIIEGYTKGQS